MTRWRAFFSDYRDLSQGMLFEKGKGPTAYANIAADFEVVNASAYDALKDRVRELEIALVTADELLEKYETTHLGWETPESTINPVQHDIRMIRAHIAGSLMTEDERDRQT